MLPSSKQYGAWLAVVRIYAGFFWLLHGYGKLTDPLWTAPNGSFYSMVSGMSGQTSGFYHDFVVNTVIPNIGVFATLVMWGETLTGLALVLGLLTRLGGGVGVLLALQYFLAKGAYAHLDGYAGLEVAAIGLTFVNVVLPTGKVFGLDALLRSKGGR